MNALCLLCRKPDRIWCNFLKDFRFYKVFIMIDDFEIDIDDFKKDYPHMKFLQIHDSHCNAVNYTGVNYWVKKDITSWEKALFYFFYINKNYEHVWFIEDDVFFYNESIVKNIDEQYPNEDLLTRVPHIPKKHKPEWGPTQNLIDPINTAMCCATRMSQKMLKSLDDFVKKTGRFCFLEILFPTLAYQLKLDYKNPNELLTVVYHPDKSIRKKVFSDKVKVNVFHPVKDIYKHIIYRERILH